MEHLISHKLMWLLPKLKKKYKALFFMETNVDNVGSRLTFFLSVVGNFFSRFVGSQFNIFRFRR